MLNGQELTFPADSVKAAQQRLVEACMKLAMTPQGAAISAFVNGSVMSAKIDALVEYTAPFELDENGSPVMKATFEQTLLKYLDAQTQAFENAAKEAPRIIKSAAGHG